ncbi:hypothetical protein [cf. Phormidesmis sp. LEGE 11477]|uniref:hypothetical protein n=1 Tax=cf. Phormidesmis sp. LEGE 11477 TaxID=1828680 RepID=UPI00187FB801|nr:hypothetical protein [cf. Phormidesmis sp. LEGE 11477]MBE9064531.1 hypothetical protein [cf. Phormidesmis sp. LEGE 11477]
MAGIKSLKVSVTEPPAQARVEATVTFSQKEQELGLKYILWVTLYDKDLGRDQQWLYPNFPYMPSAQWAKSDKDDFLMYLPGKWLNPTQSEVVVPLSASLTERDNRGIDATPRVRSAISNDADNNGTLELYARAVVVPETSYAVRYSSTQPVPMSELQVAF